MAGGGTGGHVVPSLAVACQLAQRGHESLFVGTRQGLEARLVPAAGFPIDWIEIGGLKRVGLQKTLQSLGQLPASVTRCLAILRDRKAAGVFSMGGYVAGPVMLAAWKARVPMILMEANAVPGLVSRAMGRFVQRALVSFPETLGFFPAGRVEITGLPVRPEFFALQPKPPGAEFTVLVTGGSRGSQALNRASAESWPHIVSSGAAVRFVLQCGAAQQSELAARFRETRLAGEVTPFIADMAAAYAGADLVVSRSGAGAVAELAAAGRPSILVPFPFATDNHQHSNAQAMARAGAAVLLPEAELNGQTLFEGIARLRHEPEMLASMGHRAKSMARTGAAERAAELLMELAISH
jgi:UDP-N-acetylglucosamine--N-acetylmuramyl-(pentapeptide) pyrophosphoryl-undecaprenol N-acetylglucosamine transferase